MTIWRGNSEWIADTRRDYVRFGDHTFPQSVIWQFHGDDGEPDLFARYELRDSRPVCVEVHVTAKPDGRPVRTSDLEALAVDQMLVAGFASFATVQVYRPDGSMIAALPADIDSEAEFRRILQQVETQVKARGSGVAQSELERVADVYLASDTDPTQAVMNALGYGSRSTTARRVKQAEDAGLLPPSRGAGKRRGAR